MALHFVKYGLDHFLPRKTFSSFGIFQLGFRLVLIDGDIYFGAPSQFRKIRIFFNVLK